MRLTDGQLEGLAMVAGATRQSNHIRPDLPRFTFRMSDLHKFVLMVVAHHSEEPRAMTAQQPAPQPLTPEQRARLIDQAGDIFDGLSTDDFADELITLVERTHGIGEQS